MSVRTVRIDGVTLPCLAFEQRAYGVGFVIPLENGWNAYVIGFIRSDETEYSVAPITRHEADRVAAGEWGIGAEIGFGDPSCHRPDITWPRGDPDLHESLIDMAAWPSPPPGVGV